MRRLLRGIRFKFIVIYLFLGLAPLLVMSYHASHVGSVALENLSSQQLTNLTEKTASQINQQLSNIYKDLDLLANYPFIQLAFLQFSFGQRLATVEQKLLRYKTQNPLYAQISLVTFDDKMILTVPENNNFQAETFFDPQVLSSTGDNTFSKKVILSHPEKSLLIFSKTVFDFEDSSRPVGHLVFYVKLQSLANYVEELTPVPGTIGFVFDHELNGLISTLPLPLDIKIHVADITLNPKQSQRKKLSKYRLYWSRVSKLDWTIGLILPEQALLGTISKLKIRSLTFSALVAVLALLITLYFVGRITDPITQLMRGAQEFSTGNLDHRIKIKGESELRRLGEKYNAMASQLKSRERQIVQVDRLASLGSMAAGIAHEVRNPLAGIKSCAQLIKRKSVSAEIESLAKGIDVEIDRLDQIVKQLLDFAKPSEAAQQSIALEEVIKEILKMVKKAFEQQQIEIKTKIQKIPNVKTDAGHVQQILLNLILNAAQAMPKGGELIISLESNDREAKLKVTDTGYGITANDLDRIFDPFFTTRPSGTGLGLSVVHSLMKRNHIGWEIKSDPHIGTVFELIFQFPSKGGSV